MTLEKLTARGLTYSDYPIYSDETLSPYIHRALYNDNGYADNSLHECIPDIYCSDMYDLVASYYLDVISAFDYCKLGKFN